MTKDQDREAFERAITVEGLHVNLTRIGPADSQAGEYAHTIVKTCWHVWQQALDYAREQEATKNERREELQMQSRPHIFRAFHREYGMIYYEEHFSLDYDSDDFIISQDTGLKDKHGKTVWEGDIVKAVLLDDYGYKPEEVIEEVRLYEGLLAPFYMRVCYEEQWWKDCLEDGFEVIGNIYEHPNLIEKS